MTEVILMPRSYYYSRLRIISVKIPNEYVEALDRLVKHGFYGNRSEAIREAIRDLLVRKGVEVVE